MTIRATTPRRIVGGSEVEAHHPEQGVQEPFGLTQREMVVGMATMDRWNLQVEAGRVEEASELLDEILKITASELPEESAEE